MRFLPPLTFKVMIIFCLFYDFFFQIISSKWNYIASVISWNRTCCIVSKSVILRIFSILWIASGKVLTQISILYFNNFRREIFEWSANVLLVRDEVHFHWKLLWFFTQNIYNQSWILDTLPTSKMELFVIVIIGKNIFSW